MPPPVAATRIGEDFGFGGENWLIASRSGRVVAKLEAADRAARAVAALRVVTEHLPGSTAPVLAMWAEGDLGVTVSEYISPAVQGDVLRACSVPQAEAMVDLAARIHQLPPPDDLPTFVLASWDEERWRSRVTAAARRFPDLVLDGVLDHLLTDFPGRVDDAIDRLGAAAASTIHGDLHLDNVLWRPGVRPVLVDWSSAAVGPRSIDLAALLVGGGVGDSERIAALDRYATASRADPADVVAEFADAVVWITGATIGGAGREEVIEHGSRKEAVMTHALRSVITATGL